MAGGGGFPEPAEIIAGLSSVLTTIIGFFAVRLHDRVDALEKQKVEEAKTLVTRQELNEYIETATAERRQMHQDNRDDGEETRKLLEKIFTKLDDHSELKEKVRRSEMDIDRLNNRLNSLPHHPQQPTR